MREWKSTAQKPRVMRFMCGCRLIKNNAWASYWRKVFQNHNLYEKPRLLQKYLLYWHQRYNSRQWIQFPVITSPQLVYSARCDDKMLYTCVWTFFFDTIFTLGATGIDGNDCVLHITTSFQEIFLLLVLMKLNLVIYTTHVIYSIWTAECQRGPFKISFILYLLDKSVVKVSLTFGNGLGENNVALYLFYFIFSHLPTRRLFRCLWSYINVFGVWFWVTTGINNWSLFYDMCLVWIH